MKTYYYTDALNDDFASSKSKIKPRKIDENYRYEHNNIAYRVLSFILYRIIATPLAYLYCKLFRRCVIKNRKALKKLRGGYFLYCNHTHGVADVFTPSLMAFPHRVSIIAHPNGVSVPIVGKITPMLGAIPLPDTISATKNFLRRIESDIKLNNVIAIYPEAHIWPYYNKIRPFGDSSFAYPIRFDVPTVACCVTYRKRKLLKHLPPLTTITVSEPIYPSQYATKAELRQMVYDFMVEVTQKENSFGYNLYIKKEKADENNDSM